MGNMRDDNASGKQTPGKSGLNNPQDQRTGNKSGQQNREPNSDRGNMSK